MCFFLLHVQRAHVYLLNICPRIRTCLEGGDHKQFNLKDEAGKGRGKGQGCHYHFSMQSYAPVSSYYCSEDSLIHFV